MLCLFTSYITVPREILIIKCHSVKFLTSKLICRPADKHSENVIYHTSTPYQQNFIHSKEMQGRTRDSSTKHWTLIRWVSVNLHLHISLTNIWNITRGIKRKRKGRHALTSLNIWCILTHNHIWHYGVYIKINFGEKYCRNYVTGPQWIGRDPMAESCEKKLMIIQVSYAAGNSWLFHRIFASQEGMCSTNVASSHKVVPHLTLSRKRST